MRKILISTAAFIASIGLANALDFGPAPVSYEDSALEYIEGRLDDPKGTTGAALGEPYKVLVDLDGGDAEACWAVDMRIRTSLGNGRTGRDTLTVIFYDDEAVALENDLRTQMTEYSEDAILYASN